MTSPQPRKKKSETRQLTALAATRVSRDELDQLRVVAGQHGQSVSNYLRSLIQRELRAP